MRDPINATALGQSTAAMQWVFAKASGRKGGRASAAKRRRRKAAKSAAPRRRRRSTSKARKFVKGSAAAKRHMAKLRRMRKR